MYKKFFPWFEKNPNLVYFDSAATTLKAQIVIDKINEYYITQSSNSHNTDSIFTNNVSIVIDETRKKTADLFKVDFDEIVFTSGATESLNMIANSLSGLVSKDDEIVLTYLEHASNLLPWYNLRDEKGLKIKFVDADKVDLKPEDFIAQLTEKTKIVSFTGASNVLGNKIDVKPIVEAIRKFNKDIFICLDIAQLIQHYPVDLKYWDVDFAAFSCHKLFGPTGLGGAFIKKELISKIKPYKFGGNMNSNIKEETFDSKDNYLKFEGGTINMAGIYGWLGSLEFINEIGYENIFKYEDKLINYAVGKLSKIKDIHLYNLENSRIVSFNIKGVFCQDLASYLGTKNFIVRSGFGCAKLLNEVLKCDGIVRISFSIYNTTAEIDKLFNVLNKFKKGDEISVIL